MRTAPKTTLAAIVVAGLVATTAGAASASAQPQPERFVIGGVGALSVAAGGRVLAFGTSNEALVGWQTGNVSDAVVWSESAGYRLAYTAGQAPRGRESAANRVAISRSGRFVTWSTKSPRPGGIVGVEEDSNTFLYDRQAGTTERISVPVGGVTAPSGDFTYRRSSVSEDGAIVAFEALGADMVPGQVGWGGGLFVRDRRRGVTVPVLVPIDGRPLDGIGIIGRHALTPDGRQLVFDSNASNLVPGDTNGMQDVFVRDLVAGTTELVSLNNRGLQARPLRPFGEQTEVSETSISDDGRFVTWTSESTNLDLRVQGRVEDYSDVFIRDRLRRDTRQMSVTSTYLSAGADHESRESQISGDGRLVCFQTRSRFFGGGQENRRIVLYDVRTGTVRRLPQVQLAHGCDLDHNASTLTYIGRIGDSFAPTDAYRLDLLPSARP